MSGGSFNYLCDAHFDRNGDLAEMANELRRLGFHDIARETQSFVFAPTDGLRKVWREVEWWRSCDSSQADAIRVAAAYDLMRPATRSSYRDVVECRCGRYFTLTELLASTPANASDA